MTDIDMRKPMWHKATGRVVKWRSTMTVDDEVSHVLEYEKSGVKVTVKDAELDQYENFDRDGAAALGGTAWQGVDFPHPHLSAPAPTNKQWPLVRGLDLNMPLRDKVSKAEVEVVRIQKVWDAEGKKQYDTVQLRDKFGGFVTRKGFNIVADYYENFKREAPTAPPQIPPTHLSRQLVQAVDERETLKQSLTEINKTIADLLHQIKEGNEL